MASENYVSVTCPRCGHPWNVNLNELDDPGRPVYRGAAAPKTPRQYRAKCPNCGTYTVFDVPKEGDDD